MLKFGESVIRNQFFRNRLADDSAHSHTHGGWSEDKNIKSNKKIPNPLTPCEKTY